MGANWSYFGETTRRVAKMSRQKELLRCACQNEWCFGTCTIHPSFRGFNPPNDALDFLSYRFYQGKSNPTRVSKSLIKGLLLTVKRRLPKH